MSTQTTRRSLLAGAAAMPALAVPALARDASPFDRQAALARLEHIVHVLRTSYVCHGWRLDEAKAANMLANFDDFDETVKPWVIDHNQSFDWIFRGDPGSMICRFASNS